jgi:MSHA biogenesis protein MshE
MTKLPVWCAAKSTSRSSPRASCWPWSIASITAEQITGLAKELTAELGDVPVEFGDCSASTTGAEDAPVVKLLQTVFEEAMRLRASDIHFEPQEKSLRIRFRIDGVLHMQTEADAKIASAVALRLKLMSGLDISEKRLPQDGRFNIKVRNNPVDVRISTCRRSTANRWSCAC